MTPAYEGFCITFEFMECLTGSNMRLFIKYNHVLYYQMDAFR